MKHFESRAFKIFRTIRFFFYFIFFLVFLIIPTTYFINNPVFCIYYSKYNLLCPTCGVTRAFSSIMHFKYAQAYEYNPVFTIAFGPIFIFLFLQDFFNITFNFIKKKNTYSIIEYLIFIFL